MPNFPKRFNIFIYLYSVMRIWCFNLLQHFFSLFSIR
jgi:hypothetical protein